MLFEEVELEATFTGEADSCPDFIPLSFLVPNDLDLTFLGMGERASWGLRRQLKFVCMNSQGSVASKNIPRVL